MAHTHNEYVKLIEFFDKCPKEVFAAIALSFATRLTDYEDLEKAVQEIKNEWECLYSNKIIRQKPIKSQIKNA